jgi:hypothetical protein
VPADRFQQRNNFSLSLGGKLLRVDYLISLLFITEAMRWSSVEERLRTIPG